MFRDVIPEPPEDLAPAPIRADRIDPDRLLAIARRNLWLAVLVLGVALAAGFAWTVLSVRTYTAAARLQIEQQVERVLPGEDAAPTPPAQDAERFLQTQTDVLRSRSVAIGVAQSLRLWRNAGFHAAMGVRVESGAAGREQVIALLQRNLRVDLPRNSRVVTLSFTARDPRQAAAIANAFAEVFIASNLQRKFASSAYARDFLAGQLVEAKARLERSERDLNGYARAAGLLAARPALGRDGGETTAQSVTTASLAQLNDAYNAARAARIEAEQRWRAAAATPVLSLPEVLASPAVQALLQQRATLTAELRQARERYRAEYPLLAEKQGQLAELDAEIGQLAGAIRGSVRNRYRVALAQERSLAAAVGGLKQSTLAEQDRSVRFTILSREVDTNRTLYDGLLQRFKEVSAAAGVSSNNIAVVDRAEPPLRPTAPRPVFNLALALIAGLVLATLAVLVRERTDDAVRGPGDMEEKLGLAPLGVVPRLAAGEDVTEALRTPRSALAEAYDALRSALLYSTADGLPRSVLVTSTEAGEGKSTTSIAVAAGLARLGRRVALVDADLRRPSLHRLLPDSPARGLSDLLIGQAAIADVAMSTGDEGLWLIASGPLPPNPADLLSGPRLTDVVRALEAAYDLVVIDGPPVLGLADAPMLAAQAQGVLFVIEANKGLRGRTRSALRRLRQTDARLLGGLLTKFEARRAGVDRYYDRSYDYSGVR
jgi:polysaccharide biosynthesis transport protein